MPPESLRKETCPLCGFAFDRTTSSCSAGCPLASGCQMVCCPRCFYSYPQESFLAGRLRRLFYRSEKEGR